MELKRYSKFEQKPFLLYRYWWNTWIFPFTKKSYLHRAQWRYYFYLSRVRILVSPWNFRILTFSNRKYKYYCLYFSFVTLYPSFITFLWQAFCDMWPLGNCTILLFRKWIKKSCVLCRNFISIYKINRTLHGCLGIRILLSCAERISHLFASLTRERYFQHSKIKFVSPCSHLISSIYNTLVH